MPAEDVSTCGANTTVRFELRGWFATTSSSGGGANGDFMSPGGVMRAFITVDG